MRLSCGRFRHQDCVLVSLLLRTLVGVAHLRPHSTSGMFRRIVMEYNSSAGPLLDRRIPRVRTHVNRPNDSLQSKSHPSLTTPILPPKTSSMLDLTIQQHTSLGNCRDARTNIRLATSSANSAQYCAPRNSVPDPRRARSIPIVPIQAPQAFIIRLCA